jgi:hypothetical protein
VTCFNQAPNRSYDRGIFTNPNRMKAIWISNLKENAP